MIDYTLIRSKRKTAALYIRGGRLEARVPLKMPKRDIDRFVLSKEKWIADKLKISSEQASRREMFTLDYGSFVLYRGKQCPLTAKTGNSIGFDDGQFYLPPGLPPEQIKAACIQIYRILAKRDLSAKTLEYAKLMSAAPAGIRVNGAKTRWGSCSARKTINYSWRLIMAGDDVIDYVVVHELAHLTEMNHSARFWAIVEGVLPDFRERKTRLRELQKKLAAENWDL